jgi:hypothetical protein
MTQWLLVDDWLLRVQKIDCTKIYGKMVRDRCGNHLSSNHPRRRRRKMHPPPHPLLCPSRALFL